MFVDNQKNSEIAIKPERRSTTKLYIPDISFLTKCKLPLTIDLRQPKTVLDLLEALIKEEKARNFKHRGLFVLGSVAYGKANNGSDIDLLHIVSTDWLNRRRADELYWPLRFRLEAIFKHCFGIEVQNGMRAANLSGSASEIRSAADTLDKFSIPIGITPQDLEKIEKATKFKNREPFSKIKPPEKQSRETGPHVYKFPDEGIFPWEIEYCLLEKLD